MANSNEVIRYSDKELKDFSKIVDDKIAHATEQLDFFQEQIKAIGQSEESKLKGLDDGTSSTETERLYSMANRQKKLIQHLENAKMRIHNKVYGICRATGKLISKERLKAVPHATLSIEAKQNQRK